MVGGTLLVISDTVSGFDRTLPLNSRLGVLTLLLMEYGLGVHKIHTFLACNVS